MLEFGTAGIRGIVGDKDDQLNLAHAAMIFDAFAKFLNDKYKNVKDKFIVIGRDNRIKGIEFTNLAADILTKQGINVYFNNQMFPTPFISFLIKHKKTLGGINVTASHNPKEYNGIKLYNQFGYQTLPNEISEIKKYMSSYDNYKHYINTTIEVCESNLIHKIEEQDFEYYINEVISLNEKNLDLSNIKIVYSPLHGTGYSFVHKIFKKVKSNIIYQKDEIKEDPNFSFVSNPNPETKEAFKNTIDLAIKENADLIVITDPDSDRVGVAYREGDEFKLINGNENAILITDYLLNNKQIDKSKDNYLVYSFVSTSLPTKMCSKHNIKSYITETGFKWIGRTIEDNKSKSNFFFAFEESYGSLINERIALDKDAIQSVLAIAMIASLAKKENKNLNDKLNSIYEEYGFMKAKSFSFDLKDASQLKELKEKFKQINFENAILYDYSLGIRNIDPNEMLSYEFNNSSNWVALRPSGTEPKFKIYIHVVESSKEKSNEVFENYLNIIKSKLSI